MNKQIREELQKVTAVTLPPYTEDTTELFISKTGTTTQKALELEVGRCFLIKVERYITNPPQNFTLHEQWNNGNIPKQQYFKCEIVQIIGKMIKINGNGFDHDKQLDLNYHWEGWLPKQSITILEEI